MWMDCSVVVLIGLAALMAALPTRPVSAILVFAAALTAPGAAILTRVQVGEPLTLAGLTIGLSLAVDVVIGLVLIWSGWWHPVVAVGVVAAVAAVVLGLDALAHRRLSEGMRR